MATAQASNHYRIEASDLHEPKGPLFINNQATMVGVYTPNGKKIYVLPWKDRPMPQAPTPVASTSPSEIYCVRGMHYKKHAGPGGPLTPFLGTGPRLPASATPQSVEAIRSAAAAASRRETPPVNSAATLAVNDLYDEDRQGGADGGQDTAPADDAGAGEAGDASADAPAADAAVTPPADNPVGLRHKNKVLPTPKPSGKQ